MLVAFRIGHYYYNHDHWVAKGTVVWLGLMTVLVAFLLRILWYPVIEGVGLVFVGQATLVVVS